MLPRKLLFRLGDVVPEMDTLFIFQGLDDLPRGVITDMTREILSKYQMKKEIVVQVISIPHGTYTQTYILV